MALRKNKKIQEEGNKKRYIFGRFSKWMWLGTGIAVLLGFLLLLIISFSNLPSFEELENPDIDYASAIYADNGEEYGRFFVENRVAVPFDSLNPYLIDALISTEDIRYYRHSGIDMKALFRVLFKTILLRKESSGGGSTITQQLAKQLYSSRDFSNMGSIRKAFTLISYKLKEWITAVKLERSYTKNEIIAMYLNNYDFIYGARGVEAAAETYFGKSQSDLNIHEAATLIGMLKNSSLYNPKRFNDIARDRRNVVLSQMKNAKHITQSEYDTLSSIDLDASNFYRSDEISKGIAPYFRSKISGMVSDIIRDNEIEKSDGTLYNVYKDGLKIYTPINVRMQKMLEASVTEHLSSHQEKFFKHWNNIDLWEYSNDGYPVDLKQKRLKKLMKTSERYYNLQGKLLADNIAEINEAFEVQLKDYDLDRLIKTADDAQYLNKLHDANLISSEKAGKFSSIISSDHWPAFKSDYEELQRRVEDAFNKEVKMKIFTYENEEMEKEVTMSPLDSIKYHSMILQVGSIAMDPASGHVKAWVGGSNFKYFKYNHGDASRQVGSTFKPFLYATAIALQGFSPCFPVVDIQYTISPGESEFNLIKPWTPQNATGKYQGTSMSLYDALRKSKNTVSVFLMKQMGSVEPLRGIIHNMGIDSSAKLSNGRYKVPKQPSIALGATDLSPKEMTAAYCTFANNGVYNSPILITKIEDRNGKVLYEAIPKSQVALSDEVNYVMVNMLRKVVSGSPGFYKFKSDVGGKTGTTDSHTDGWFMGVTPGIVLGTWVGGEDRWTRFRTLRLGQGARMARPIFYNFLTKLEESEGTGYDPNKRFPKPPGEMDIILNCDEYDKFESGSDNFFEETFFEESDTNSTENDENSGGFFNF